MGDASGSTDRRAAATNLAEEILADFELRRIGPVDIVRKASRLARLLDDDESLEWLKFEIAGYPLGALSTDAWRAAKRSGRLYFEVAEDKNAGLHGNCCCTRFDR